MGIVIFNECEVVFHNSEQKRPIIFISNLFIQFRHVLINWYTDGLWIFLPVHIMIPWHNE